MGAGTLKKYGVKKNNVFRFAEKTIVVLEGDLGKIQENINLIEQELFDSKGDYLKQTSRVIVIYTCDETKPVLLKSYEFDKTGRESYQGLL